MEDNVTQSSPITMILYIIDNDKRTPSQNWEIIPKKKYTIGRSKKEVDLPLNIKLLSRKHAELIYYDSKTIMIKDLNSRNGTFINKLKIEPLKETFFTNKEMLSFGNINNEIVFFDKSEQHKDDLPITDSEKSKESEDEQNEKIEKKIDINKENEKVFKNENIEEINTDIKRNERIEKENTPFVNQRKELESERMIENRSIERQRELKEELYDKKNKFETYSKSSKEPSKQRELEREKNNQYSISNKDTYQNKKDYNFRREQNASSYERRSRRYDKRRELSNLSNKSKSREKAKNSRSRSRSLSRSGSRETLVQQNNNLQNREMEYPPEKSSFNKEYHSYDAERENEKLRKEYLRRKEYEERRRQEKEEEEYRKRIDMERKREREIERDRERDREKERQRENYYRGRREAYNNKYFEPGNRIVLKPERLDIVMNKNFGDNRNNNVRNNDDDMGYIKCYVEGYMYLKIKKSE